MCLRCLPEGTTAETGYAQPMVRHPDGRPMANRLHHRQGTVKVTEHGTKRITGTTCGLVVPARRTCDGTHLERQRKGGLSRHLFIYSSLASLKLFNLSGRSCIRMGRKGIHGPSWISSSAQRNACTNSRIRLQMVHVQGGGHLRQEHQGILPCPCLLCER